MCLGYIHDTVLGAWNTLVNKRDKNLLPFWSLYSLLTFKVNNSVIAGFSFLGNTNYLRKS